MRRFTAATVTALLAGTALAAGTGAARASDRGFSFHVLGRLQLERVNTRTGETHSGYLMCMSTQAGGAAPVIYGVGTVKDATAACEELAAVKGDFDALAVHPTWLAPAIFAPVAVRAAGSWEGAKIAWRQEYSNSGLLARRTGDVFAF